MTRKHFEAIAATIRETRPGCREQDTYQLRLAHAFADMLADTNDRFDRERFLVACGTVSPEERT